MLKQVNVLAAVSEDDRQGLNRSLVAAGAKVWAANEAWQTDDAPAMDLAVVAVDDEGRLKAVGLSTPLVKLGLPMLGVVDRDTPEKARLTAFKAGVADILERPLAPSAVLARVGLLSQQSRLAARIREAGMEDPQTGLPSATYFIVRMEQELCRARRHVEGITTLCVVLDVPPNVEEHIGWPDTGRLLRSVARVLQERTRGHDVVARSGSTRFATCLWACSSEYALAAAENVREGIESALIQAGTLGFITATIGAASYDGVGQHDGAAALYERALNAARAAVEAGGNRIGLCKEGS